MFLFASYLSTMISTKKMRPTRATNVRKDRRRHLSRSSGADKLSASIGELQEDGVLDRSPWYKCQQAIAFAFCCSDLPQRLLSDLVAGLAQRQRGIPPDLQVLALEGLREQLRARLVLAIVGKEDVRPARPRRVNTRTTRALGGNRFRLADGLVSYDLDWRATAGLDRAG